MCYNAGLWLKAENYFPHVDAAAKNGSSLKINIHGEMCLVSNVWGEYQNRYTGIHAFHVLGSVKPHSGVNLDEVKWATLVSHFGKIKVVLKGENVSLKGLKRPHDADDGVTVYQADWFLNGAIVESDNPSTDFYSYEKAVQDAEMWKPEVGKHYSKMDGVPELKVTEKTVPPPRRNGFNELDFCLQYGKANRSWG